MVNLKRTVEGDFIENLLNESEYMIICTLKEMFNLTWEINRWKFYSLNTRSLN